jgi:hypothetical protein
MSILPLLLVSIPFAIGNYKIAGRMGASQPLWLVFSLIPFVNVFFNFYVWYAVVIRILDMLTSISARPSAR